MAKKPTFTQCIDAAVKSGDISRNRAKVIKHQYSKLQGSLSGKPQAQAALKATTQEILERKRGQLIQAAIQRRNDAAILEAPKHKHTSAAYGMFESVGLDPDVVSFLGKRQIVGVFDRAEALKTVAHSKFAEGMDKFRRTLTGETRNKGILTEVERVVHGGKSTDPDANAIAKAWAETAEWLRLEFNRAGGSIPKLNDWGMPQSHDVSALMGAGKATWIADVKPMLDLGRMKLDPAEADQVLGEVYDTITSEGFSKLDAPPGQTGGKAVGNRRLDHRYLQFADADKSVAYREKYGEGDAFTSMISYMDGMIRDIAAMQTFGKNPPSGIKAIQWRLNKIAQEAPRGWATDRKKYAANFIEDLYGHFIGSAHSPGSEKFATIGASVRQTLASTQLGRAILSAITDPTFAHLTAKYNGLPQWRSISEGLKLLDPSRPADRLFAVQAGLVADEWGHVASAGARWTGEIIGAHNYSNRLSDFLLRTTGLAPYTQANRWGTGLNFAFGFQNFKGKTFGDLSGGTAQEKAFSTFLDHYGITPDEWDIFRATTSSELRGVKLLRPAAFMERTDLDPKIQNDIAAKMFAGIRAEVQHGTPSMTHRAKVHVLRSNRPGTPAGEFLRGGLMYKAFPMSLWMTHIMRGWHQGGSAVRANAGYKTRYGYLAALLGPTTMMGALAMQLKEIQKGNDPRDTTDPAFWAAAVAQGGGLGLFGDFLLQDVNRYGGGMAESLAGPPVALINDIRKLTLGNIAQAMQGKDSHAALELANFAKRYTPVLSTHVALSPIFDKEIISRIQRQVDRDAYGRQRRAERKRQSEYGQGTWWKTRPGPPLSGIERPPNINPENLIELSEELFGK